MDGDGLTRMHVSNLGFFEIGSDPDVLGFGDGEHLLAGRKMLTNFNGFIADNAIGREQEFCSTVD